MPATPDYVKAVENHPMPFEKIKEDLETGAYQPYSDRDSHVPADPKERANMPRKRIQGVGLAKRFASYRKYGMGGPNRLPPREPARIHGTGTDETVVTASGAKVKKSDWDKNHAPQAGPPAPRDGQTARFEGKKASEFGAEAAQRQKRDNAFSRFIKKGRTLPAKNFNRSQALA